MQLVANLTRGNNIYDFELTHGLSNVETSMLANFPGSDHELVSCFLHILPSSRTSATTAQLLAISYKLANWAGLTAAPRNLEWANFFLSSGSQEAVDILCANLHTTNKNFTPHRS